MSASKVSTQDVIKGGSTNRLGSTAMVPHGLVVAHGGNS